MHPPGLQMPCSRCHWSTRLRPSDVVSLDTGHQVGEACFPLSSPREWMRSPLCTVAGYSSQNGFSRPGGGLGTINDLAFAENISDVVRHRLWAQDQHFSNLGIAFAVDDGGQ